MRTYIHDIEDDDSSNDSLIVAIDQYRQELINGSPPDLTSFLKSYPDIADELANAINALCRIHQSDTNSKQNKSENSIINSFDYEGSMLGQYLIVREIGRGAMGVVFEAEDIILNRRVAIKLTFDEILSNADRKRFQREASIAASLHHPNIVPIFNVGEVSGKFFYSMQLIKGESLEHRIILNNKNSVRNLHSLLSGIQLKSRRNNSSLKTDNITALNGFNNSLDSRTIDNSDLSSPEISSFLDYQFIARIGIDLALALAYAHKKGIKHFDVKPGNVLIDKNMKVWLTDFGLAQFQQRNSRSESVVGTVGYMSPEMMGVTPGVVDHRSDIYSLGCLIYSVSTGSPTFSGMISDYREWIRSEDPTPIRKFNRNFPYDLDLIIQKAMSKAVDNRYQFASELAEDLQRFLDHRPILALPKSWTNIAKKMLWRNRVLASAVLATLFISMSVTSVTTLILFRKTKESESRYSELVSNLFLNLNDEGSIINSSDPKVQYSRFSMIADVMDQRVHLGIASNRERFLAAQMNFYAALQLIKMIKYKPEIIDRLNRSIEIFNLHAQLTKNPIFKLDALRSKNYLTNYYENTQKYDLVRSTIEDMNQDMIILVNEFPNDLRFADAQIAYLMKLAEMNMLNGDFQTSRNQFEKSRNMALSIPFNNPKKQYANPWYFYAANAVRSGFYISLIDAKSGNYKSAEDQLIEDIDLINKMIFDASNDNEDITGFTGLSLYSKKELINVLVDQNRFDESLVLINQFFQDAEEFENKYPRSMKFINEITHLGLLASRLFIAKGNTQKASDILEMSLLWAKQLSTYHARLLLEKYDSDHQDAQTVLTLLQSNINTQEPQNNEVILIIAEANMRNGNYLTALSYLNKIVVKPGRNISETAFSVRFHLLFCEALLNIGDSEQSRNHWISAIKLTSMLRPHEVILLKELHEKVERRVKLK